MDATTVHVKNISAETTEKEVQDFFSFCGKISSLSITKEADGKQVAAVAFEKPTAAKTALLLDNTQLGANFVEVSSASTIDDLAEKSAPADSTASGDSIEQEDKPRSRILAEYLAQGYVVSDKAIERAIALDNQHGVSARFTAALQSFDSKFGATEKAQTVDQKLGVTDKAMTGWHHLSTYFEKALGTPSGQKVREFYEKSNKQVLDVHSEARRLADLKNEKATTGTNPATEKPGDAAVAYSESAEKPT